jgi:hypothetical protein
MAATTLTPGLIAHYRSTAYRVLDSGFDFAMNIDQPCAALVECMQHFQVTEAAYLTAWNPRSEPTPMARNKAAQRALETEVASRGWRLLYGEGVGSDETWEPEPSILVLGISHDAACGLGRKYGQNALVTARMDDGAVPRLVLLV